MKNTILIIAVFFTLIAAGQPPVIGAKDLLRHPIDTLIPIPASNVNGMDRRVAIRTLTIDFQNETMTLSLMVYFFRSDTIVFTQQTHPYKVPLTASNRTRVNYSGQVQSDTCMVGCVGEFDFLRHLASTPISTMSEIYYYIYQGVAEGKFD